jgi:hypothetical protein
MLLTTPMLEMFHGLNVLGSYNMDSHKARDSNVDYLYEWFDNGLLLAVTLLDPTQAYQYFLSRREGSVSDMGKAYASIEPLAPDHQSNETPRSARSR